MSNNNTNKNEKSEPKSISSATPAIVATTRTTGTANKPKEQQSKDNNNNKEETITISKQEYDNLKNTIERLAHKLGDTKAKLNRIHGVLIQTQVTVYNTSNAI